MLVGEDLVAFDDLGQISFEEFSHHVDIIEFLPGLR